MVPTTDGDIYLRSHIPPRIKAEFETWMEGYARRRVFDLRPGGPAPPDQQMDAEEHQASLDNVTELVGAGKFRWGAKACREALGDIPGIVQMVVLLSQSADRRMNLKQGLTQEKVLNWLDMDSPNGGPTWMQVGAVIKQIIKDTPNFMSPPTRGMTAD